MKTLVVIEAKALNDKQDIENLKLSQMALNAEADDHTNQLLELQQQLREARDTINTLGGGIESTLQKKNKQQQQSPRNSSGSISIKGGTVSGVVNSEPSVMSFDESTSSMLASKSLRRTDSGSISSINRVGSSQWISAFRIAAQKSIDDNRSRPMLIKECRDFITRAYISRAAAVKQTNYVTQLTNIISLSHFILFVLFLYSIRSLKVWKCIFIGHLKQDLDFAL